jgi:5-formyltetrahydrofolate cyclo-ligase
MVVPPTALSELRIELRKRRQVIAKQNIKVSLTVDAELRELINPATAIGFYLPIGGEPDPLPLIFGYAGVTSLPALTADDPLMTFRRWSPGDSLMTSAWGGQQPLDTAATVIPDLIIVPLLGFDSAFNRIGQGGGHYDRYLAAHPSACRIGLAWEGQRVDSILAQPWDISLDAILTETGFHLKDLTRCQRP